MSRIAVVTPYPPGRDGIATYAVQEVQRLREEGHDVRVISPLPSAAHAHVGLGHAVGWGRLLARLGEVDQVLVQIYPELVYGRCRTSPERAACWLAIAAICRRVPTVLRVHEIEYPPLEAHATERRAFLAVLQQARAVTVHTEQEQARLAEVLGVAQDRIGLVEHGQHFVRHCNLDRAAARAELQLDPDAHLFLSIGFLQAHKGFDRGVRAFARLAPDRAEFHVVGSVRVAHPDLIRYATELRQLTDATDHAFLHERYVTDADFDLWLVAADTVVLPYREIWSSSVIERAKLYGRPVIAAATGGLVSQVADAGVLVSSDAELIEAMAARLGIEIPAVGPDEEFVGREALQERIRRPAGSAPAATAGSAVESMSKLGGPMPPVAPDSARPGVAALKRSIQRLTFWQTQPVLDRVNELQAATAEAVRRLEREQSETE